MATKKIELDVIAKDKASAVLSKVSKSVDDVGKKSKSMSNDMAKGITQVAAPFLAVQKIIGGLGSSLEEFEKRTGKTDGLTSLKKSVGDISSQIGAGLYPAFQMLSKIVNDNKDRFLKLGAQVGTIFSGLIEIVVGFGKVFGGTILTIVGAAMERFHQLRAIILDIFGKKEAAERARSAAQAISDEFYNANKAVLDGFKQMGKGVGTVWDGISGKVKINTETMVENNDKALKEIIEKEAKARRLISEDITKWGEEAAKADYEAKKKMYENTVTWGEESAKFDYEAKVKIAEDITKWGEEAAKADWDNKQKIIENEKEKKAQIEDMILQSASIISDISSAVTDKQMEDVDKEAEKKKNIAKSNIKNKKVLEKELEKIDADAEKKRKEIAKREKQVALVMAIINTAVGVSKALSSSGPPANFIFAALTGIAGAIQVGLIASQAFARGGIVQPEAGKANTGDNILVRANPGERILTEKQNRAYENVIMGGFSSGPVTVTINGNADERTVTSALAKSREQQMYDMRRLMLEMKSNNMLPVAA